MRSLERRFNIQQDKHPYYSTLVNFGHAVEHQRFTQPIIAKYFNLLVEKSDYQASDRDAIIEHLLQLSHSEKPAEEADI